MARRGDPEHTYARLVRELTAGVGEERERYVRRELDGIWWGLNEEQRARAPQVPRAEVCSGEPERTALVDDPEDAASTEEARRQWEAEVDARMAAASKERDDG